MILQILKFQINLTEMIFNFRLRRAVKKANRNAKLMNKRYMVIVFAGKPRVYQKSALKELVKRRKFFKKGVTMERVERMAVYVTP